MTFPYPKKETERTTLVIFCLLLISLFNLVVGVIQSFVSTFRRSKNCLPSPYFSLHSFFIILSFQPPVKFLKPDFSNSSLTMSSPVNTAKSNLTTARSASLNIPHSTGTNRNHDLRYSLSAASRTNEDRPPSGNGIAGILYKWVNYGKGWKRRWFVLQDGVLSYYRIHGPDKISLSVEMDRRSKLIGGESLRFICRHSQRGDVHSPGKPLGQIHLKVIKVLKS